MNKKNYVAAKNCIKFTNTHYPNDYSKMLSAKILYKQNQTQAAIKELLPLWNNQRNQWAGLLLKEIYEKNKDDAKIRNLIESNMQY